MNKEYQDDQCMKMFMLKKMKIMKQKFQANMLSRLTTYNNKHNNNGRKMNK